MNFPSGVYSRTSARWNSFGCVSGSSIFDPEPTETNIFVVFGEDNIAGPMTSTHELSISGDIGNDRFRRACSVQIPSVIGDSLNGSGVANVDILRVLNGIERNAE